MSRRRAPSSSVAEGTREISVGARVNIVHGRSPVRPVIPGCQRGGASTCGRTAPVHDARAVSRHRRRIRSRLRGSRTRQIAPSHRRADRAANAIAGARPPFFKTRVGGAPPPEPPTRQFPCDHEADGANEKSLDHRRCGRSDAHAGRARLAGGTGVVACPAVQRVRPQVDAGASA
jgi:hypothetical protein